MKSKRTFASKIKQIHYSFNLEIYKKVIENLGFSVFHSLNIGNPMPEVLRKTGLLFGELRYF